MCILIAKPKGIDMPSEKTMKTCWNANPDGAGIAWSDGTKIFLRKGFMKWNDFIKEYRSLNLHDFNAIIHFRIATHGTVTAANTHPFSVNSHLVAGHNGILPIKNEGDWTDSETFFKRIAAPILENYRLDSQVFELAVQSIIGYSKFAFLSDKGELVTFGDFHLEDGIFYSNYSFIDYKAFYNKRKKKQQILFDEYDDGCEHDDDEYYDEYDDGCEHDDMSFEEESLYLDLVFDIYVYMEEYLNKFDDFEGAVSPIDVKNHIYTKPKYSSLSESIYNYAYQECYDSLEASYLSF